MYIVRLPDKRPRSLDKRKVYLINWLLGVQFLSLIHVQTQVAFKTVCGPFSLCHTNGHIVSVLLGWLDVFVVECLQLSLPRVL